MSFLKLIPRLLIVTYLILSLIGLFLGDSLESYHLERALQPGYDAFGRRCFELIPSVLAQSLLSVLPLAFICILVSTLIANFSTRRNPRIQMIVRSVLDTLSALPGFFIALALGVLFPESHSTFYFGGILLVIPSTIRFFEGQLIKLQSEDYLLASDAMGADYLHLWRVHYFPALVESSLTLLPFVIVRLILIEASLSFLGLSTLPHHETWGRLLAQGKDYLLEAPWILYWAAGPLCILLASFHLLSVEDQN